jgi:hypothetical protein
MSYATNGRVPRSRSSSPVVTSPPPADLARPAAGGAITAVLEQVVRDWPRQPDYPDCFHTRVLQYAPYPVPKACTVTPRQLAGQLLASDRFRALKLGRWLRRPDTPAMRAAVEALSPLPLREDIELLVSALTLAAENLQERRRALAVLVWLALSTLACLAVALVARG